MQVISSMVNPADPQFQANAEYQRALAAELRERLALVRQGGGSKYRQRQEAQGKLFVRDRIDRLLDPGSPFLEIVPLAANGMYEDQAPGAGIVTGSWRVSGREVIIFANYAAVKSGSYFPMPVKK